MDKINSRKAMHKINKVFVKRWSPRAMSGEKLTREELMSLFEAARWAPSSYNHQPWRFIYAFNGTPEWDLFFKLLVDFNRSWVKNAGALILIISNKNFEHNEEFSPTHSFDTGAAWQNLALQGHLQGLVVHGMSGFDYEMARQGLNIPKNFQIEAMAAIGKPGKREELLPELQEKEIPSERKAIFEFIFEGKFNKNWGQR